MHSLVPTCSKGCSHCCRQPILVSDIEALIIATFLKERGLNHVFDRINVWISQCPPDLSGMPATMSLADEQEFKMRYFAASIPCPLLEKEECLIYDVRPPNCLTHFSVGPSDDCQVTPFAELTIQYHPLESWMVSQLLSFAMYHQKKLPPNLKPKQLLQLHHAVLKWRFVNLKPLR